MTEKRLLQIIIAIIGLIPVTAGNPALDSHFRYLSGLLLAIGVAYWTTIPDIERAGARFSLLTMIVVTGGFFRAVGMLTSGSPGSVMTWALLVELVVTPALYLWQLRIARLAVSQGAPMDANPAAR